MITLFIYFKRQISIEIIILINNPIFKDHVETNGYLFFKIILLV